MKVLSTLALLSLLVGFHSPARAQNENTIILEEFRMRLVKPASYTRNSKDEVYPMVLALQSPEIDRYSNRFTSNNTSFTYKLLGGIYLITSPKPKTGLQDQVDNALPSDRDIEAIGKLIPGMAIEKKAQITVGGRKALSVLASLDISKTHGIQEEATLRLIFMVYKNTQMTWLFAGMNADFDKSVKDFEKTINSIRFLDDKPLTEKPATAAKPAPKKGSGKGK
jgi:hypothetical protein